MERICSKCGASQPIRTFQLWNGRCQQCSAPMTMSTSVDDWRSPPPTTQEVHDFLRYMDELTFARHYATIAKRHLPIVVFVHFVFLAGIAAKLVDPGFGLFLWITVGVLLCLTATRAMPNCPRCEAPFMANVVFGMRIPARHTRTCGTCGLRSLTQSDINRSGILDRSSVDESTVNAIQCDDSE